MSGPDAPQVPANLPYAEIPKQPRYTVVCIAWAAYDVPRMSDMLAFEPSLDTADHPAWVQVQGFSQLSELLAHHHGRLRDQHAQLSAAWQAPSAQRMLERMDRYAESLLQDAHCARETAIGLHGVLTALGEAKVKMAALHDRWDRVTNDWIPESWDDAAAELNAEARTVMEATDAAVRDHRAKILIPQYFELENRGEREFIDGTEPIQPPFPGSAVVPPVPGFDPVAGSGQLAGIPGVPAPVPAVPGAPVSMLPIQPGNPLAPYGGAYILPGPGVGKGGYLVPMRPPGATGSAGAMPGAFGPGRSGVAGGGSSGFGMMPIPLGGPMPGGAGGGAGIYRRPNTAWQAAQGVPPVIDGLDNDVVITGRPSERQEMEFRDWFADLAYPWRSDAGEPQPHVQFRRTPG